MPFSKMNTVAQLMEPRVFDYINECQTESFECFDDFDLLAFDYYDVSGAQSDTPKMLIYINRRDLFFFCEDDAAARRIEAVFSQIQAGTEGNGQLLYRFFARLLNGDMDYLERFEQTLGDGETAALGGDPQTPKQFTRWRKELLCLKRYYEQLNTIFDEMSANDNQLLPDAALRRLAVLKSRTDRYLRQVRELQEMVMQLREAYQAEVALRQNDLMKIFTVVTVIFLPLTLIVGWYGMNFASMPELHWKYGYAAVIILSVAIVGFMIWFFSRRKWF